MAVVWQFSMIELDKKTLITGVILEKIPFVYQNQISKFNNLQKLIQSYFIPRTVEQKITIRIGEKIVPAQTDKYGSFFVAIDTVQQNPVTITLSDDLPLEIIQKYPINFENTPGAFDVISDIDDTIMVSYSANFYKRIKTLLTNSPKDRKAVTFTTKLFEVFSKKNARVFYVSKSESNLFNMLTTFIELNSLPKGSLILTPYLKFHELFLSKKGKDFKINYIRFIIENSENKKFVLIGDDSQKDIEVYTIIASEYPQKILKIYLRQTNKRIPKDHGIFWKKLASLGISTKYFNNKDRIDEEITSL